MDKRINWTCSRFEELTVRQLYDILRARCEVFVVEQQCVYPDIDGLDHDALHLTGIGANGQLAAYLRILAPGVTYPEPALGRVLSTAGWRGSGAGRQLIEQGLKQIQHHYPNQAVRIGAQSYLTGFYASFGFKIDSQPYWEDGIEHVQMVLALAPDGSTK
jgi:ElaA protein